MSEINTVPGGLLSLLGLKEQGKAPSIFGGFVQPTLEMVDFYLNTLEREQTQNAVAIATVGTNLSSIVVPQNEVWAVIQMQVSCSPGVGAAIDLAAACTFGGAAAAFNYVQGPYIAATAFQDARSASTVRFLAKPGSVFGAVVRSYTAPVTYNIGIRYVPLRI